MIYSNFLHDGKQCVFQILSDRMFVCVKYFQIYLRHFTEERNAHTIRSINGHSLPQKQQKCANLNPLDFALYWVLVMAF